MRTLILSLSIAGLAGCATVVSLSLDERFGRPDPKRFDTPTPPATPALSFRTQVQPILDKRCVVCHGCYDAPCQLKLGSWEGIARGMSDKQIYDAERLLAAAPSRLFADAQRASQWRELGFDPVLNERADTPQANLAGSVLYRSLDLKRRHPLPREKVLSSEFDFSLNRAQSCSRIEQFDAHAAKAPLAGMPYGLPALSAKEMDTITRWLAAGSPAPGTEPLTAAQQQQIAQWETFLNGPSNKERLMSRYLYEHLFLGHLYFDTDSTRRPFRLVRSRTAPGEPAQIIATRRPYDDPGVERVYYRFEPERETLLAKTHMPYALNEARMAKYRGWFLAPTINVKQLPSYDVETAANPFVAFRDLPPDSRYRFLLDEAQFFIMTFIKGPVCRGQVAVNVIQDHFWVFFVDPDVSAHELRIDSLLRQTEKLRLPSEEGSNALALTSWLEYAKLQRDYLKKKNEHLLKAVQSGRVKIDLPVVWNGNSGNGNKENRNAALTVFRHFDSASVEQGLIGDAPKTAWVMGYALFERIYYLLVAGYDVYGNIGHQLNSRLYMDFMRMEGEANFLAFLPQASRRPIAERWYEGAEDEAKAYVYGQFTGVDAPSAIQYKTDDPQRELYGLLRQHLAPVLTPRFDLSAVTDARLRGYLQSLATVRGPSLSLMPEMAVLRVDLRGNERKASAPLYFSLLRNTGHANVTHLLLEKRALLPQDNTLTVVPGFLGTYPNAIYRVAENDIPAFEAAIRLLTSETDYRALADRFAVRRTASDFWAVSDALHAAYQASAAPDAGVLDYNRLENR